MSSPFFDIRMRGFRDRAEVRDVLALLDVRLAPLPAEELPVTEAAGRVLAEAVVAAVSVPHFPRAAMDGYALHAEETFGAGSYNPLLFRIVGEALPGRPFFGRVGTGEAVRIMTGAPVPEGADAVLQAEAAEEDASGLRVAEPVSPGRHIGRVGEDIEAGRAVLPASRVLRPQDVGLLASVGAGTVSVVRRPRVALLITGDELLPPGSKPEGFRIVDSNSVVLSALVRRDGGLPLPVRYLPDREELIRSAFREADADAILVSGGTSVGKEDHAPRLLSELGELPVHGVALRASPRFPPPRQPRLVPVRLRPVRRPGGAPTRRAAGGAPLPHRRTAAGGEGRFGGGAGRLRAGARHGGGRRADRRQRGVAPEHDGGGGRLRAGRARPRRLRPRRARPRLLLRRPRQRLPLPPMSDAFRQQQFLNVIDRDEAEARFRSALDLRPLQAETVPLSEVLGRVLAEDVTAPVDVPGFDRSNMDGFAVRAEDTFGASEDGPRTLRLNEETVPTGVVPTRTIEPGTATSIATGGMLPRGADAVVMVEHTDIAGGALVVTRPVAPGANVTFAGTDIGRGEAVLRRGEVLTSRETGVLAALGIAEVPVVRKPRVAILSTGDELIAPGTPTRPGLIYDSNATVLADAVRELGGEPVPLGIVPDDWEKLSEAFRRALECDAVLLSGGTSKGAGDLSYRVAGAFGPPGIVAHGVALKPGKPLCLAVIAEPPPSPFVPSPRRPVPVAVLPGFPTSAIFTFHEFVAPVLRRLAGQRDRAATVVQALLPMRVNSERGRTEYLLVGLVGIADCGLRIADWKRGDEFEAPAGAASSQSAIRNPRSAIDFVAYPMGKGSGSVTAFARADGFIVIPRQREYLEAGSVVDVHLLGAGLQPADLVVIGSHCVGLDYLLGLLHERGVTSKFLAVGSTGGLEAAKRGECDVAGIHLLDPRTNTYNHPFLTEGSDLLAGYGRLQGIVFRPDDARFAGKTVEGAVAAALADPSCILVNRNRGSGTRVLIDRLLGAARPAGYLTEAKSHQAVAAAVAQGRADWGVAIAQVARDLALGFIPLQEEQFDFVVPAARRERPAVRAFREVLESPEARRALEGMGFRRG